MPVYAHEEEIKYAFYAVATKDDFGAYLPHYLDPSFNWKPIHEKEIELFENVTFYLLPGHTPGLIGMKVDLKNSGSFFFTSDLAFFKDNYENERPLGWLIRDMAAWRRSIRKVKAIAKKSDAKVVFGHDPEVFKSMKIAPEYYD